MIVMASNQILCQWFETIPKIPDNILLMMNVLLLDSDVPKQWMVGPGVETVARNLFLYLSTSTILPIAFARIVCKMLWPTHAGSDNGIVILCLWFVLKVCIVVECWRY